MRTLKITVSTAEIMWPSHLGPILKFHFDFHSHKTFITSETSKVSLCVNVSFTIPLVLPSLAGCSMEIPT